MNYRHAFHAGNFADVFKHAILTRLLVYLCRKETPFRVIDTHAGEGIYDLSERKGGKDRRMARRSSAGCSRSPPPPEVAALLEPYLALVRPLMSANPPLYPGLAGFGAQAHPASRTG